LIQSRDEFNEGHSGSKRRVADLAGQVYAGHPRSNRLSCRGNLSGGRLSPGWDRRQEQERAERADTGGLQDAA
jgi:hypothetical protein